LQAQVIYQGEDRRVSITRAAVCMEGKGLVRRTGYRGAYKSVPGVGNENRYAYEHCGAINGASVGNKTEID